MSHYGNLPDGWVEVSLGELFEIGSAKRVMKSDWQSEGIPFYRTREVVKLAENGDVNNDLFISHKLFDEMKTKFGVPQSGDIMLTAVGTIGIPYVVRESDLFYYKDASVLCLSNIYNLNSEFFKFVLLSQRLRKQMFSSSKGTTVDTITIEKASNYRVLLPPIEEQQRIVSAVDKIISIIDWAESEQKKLTDFIIIAKSKVLELAMQGKLVPQDPADEPAAEMLRRVNPKARIICDTPHYPQLPENWVYVSLEDIVDYEQPQPYIVENTDYSDEFKTPVLTAGKSFILGYTNEEFGVYNRLPAIIFDDFTTDSHFVDFPFKVKSSAMKILSVRSGISIEYVAYFMAITRLSGDTHKRYWISEYSKILIPLPPKAEQERIVLIIKDIFKQLSLIQGLLD